MYLVLGVRGRPCLCYASVVLNVDGEATNNDINIDDCYDQVA